MMHKSNPPYKHSLAQKQRCAFSKKCKHHARPCALAKNNLQFELGSFRKFFAQFYIYILDRKPPKKCHKIYLPWAVPNGRTEAHLSLHAPNQSIFCQFLNFSKSRKTLLKQTSENFSLLGRISILVAAKSMEIKNIKGESIRGIGLNLSALLKDGNIEIDKFLFNLKEFIHYVNTPPGQVDKNKDLSNLNRDPKKPQPQAQNFANQNVERDVSEDLKKLVDKFSYCMKFYEKYCKVFEKFDFKYLDSKSQIREAYIKYLKQFGWLLFICARNDLQFDATDVPQNLCLIATVFNFILGHSPKNLSSCHITNKYPMLGSYNNDEANEILIGEVLELQVIGMKGDFYKVQLQFEAFFNKNINLPVNCLFKDKILIHIKGIDNIYTREYLNIEDMDERFFLKDRKTLFTPSKFTPFAK